MDKSNKIVIWGHKHYTDTASYFWCVFLGHFKNLGMMSIGLMIETTQVLESLIITIVFSLLTINQEQTLTAL